jgi:hypothetical protein
MKFVITAEGEIFTTRADGIYIGQQLASLRLPSHWELDLDDPFFKEAEEFVVKFPLKSENDEVIPTKIDLVQQIISEQLQKNKETK